MTPNKIRAFLESHSLKRDRTIVIVDFANVAKWNEGKVALGWNVGIPRLAQFIKHLSTGSKELRRFYYGEDYGQNPRSTTLTAWSSQMIQHAQYSNLSVETKRVKYIVDDTTPSGYRAKCDLDVEMTVDLIRLQEKYDHIVIFSGDGDLVRALRYLHDDFGKKDIYVVSARGHIGSEVIDAEKEGIITRVLYAEDLESRLNRNYQAAGDGRR